MKAQLVHNKTYGITRTIDEAFDIVVERTRAALNQEGFGVLSEIRMDEKLKEKLGIDFRRYVILGACNPELAYRTLQEDLNIGLLLPCNVVVYEASDQAKTVVAAIDPIEMMSMVGNPAINLVATEVHTRMQEAIGRI